MSLLARLADRLILYPTRAALPAVGKRRRLVAWDRGNAEVWIHTANGDDEGGAGSVSDGGGAGPADLYLLKLSGNAGRAELTGDWPATAWPEKRVEIWSCNPPGYGGSSGAARMRDFPPALSAVYAALKAEAAGRPILVMGTSLGGCGALYLAAAHDPAGAILRNPAPLGEFIRGEFCAITLGAARLIARQVPPPLDAVRQAARARAPAIFVMAMRDTVIPTEYQQRIFDAYAGDKRLIQLEDADHADPPALDEQEAIEAACREMFAWP